MSHYHFHISFRVSICSHITKFSALCIHEYFLIINESLCWLNEKNMLLFMIILILFVYLFMCPSYYSWVKFDSDFFIEMFLYTFWIKIDKKYISFQTLMSATPTSVSMVLYVLMELMDIHVCVQQVILESTVKQVRIRESRKQKGLLQWFNG